MKGLTCTSLRCAALLFFFFLFPPLPWFPNPFQHYKDLQKYLSILMISFFFFLNHSILHWSVTHRQSRAPSFILTSSRFDSAICLFTRLWFIPPSSSLCSLYLPRWKQSFLLPSGTGREIILLVGAVCKAVVFAFDIKAYKKTRYKQNKRGAVRGDCRGDGFWESPHFWCVLSRNNIIS